MRLPPLILLLCLARPASAGLLSAVSVSVKDTNGAARTTFSSNEKMLLEQIVSNAAASGNRIQFNFFILNPSGSRVFSHTGNQVPGAVGNSASRLSGVPIAQFYTGPGNYRLRAEAHLDAQVLTQEAVFTISSPNILLIYPPNGAQNLSDKPLTFRWSSSGADRYRLTVGANPSFFNSVFGESTGGTESFFAYPENPSDERQRLASGTVYYWKIEGLDASGNRVAQSEVPFSFTVQSASLTRDLAVTALDILGKSGTNINFRVRVANQGGTSESNLTLKVSLGGIPAAGSPMTLPMLGPGDQKEYSFSASQPADQGKSLAIACVDFFDDNVPNNCKTVQIEAAAVGDTSSSNRELSPDEMWQAISLLLQDQGYDLAEYDLAGADGTLTEGELKSLLDDLRSGQATVELSGPPAEAAEEGQAFFPEDGAPGAAPAAEEGGTLDKEEVWKGLSEALARVGLDLKDYELAGMDRELTAEELEFVLSELARGRAQVELSGPPEEAPAAAAGGEEAAGGPLEAPAAVETVSPEAAWEKLSGALAKLGIDLGDYEISAMDRELSEAELEALLGELARGRAQIELSGPPEEKAAEPASAAQSAARPELPPEEAAPAALEAEREWTGLCEPMGVRASFLRVADGSTWRKTWRRLTGSRAPGVDFKREMVIGVAAGRDDRADRVEIVSVRKDLAGLLVRFRLVVDRRLVEPLGPERAATRDRVPYALKVIEKTGLKIRFKRVGRGALRRARGASPEAEERGEGDE